MKSFHRQCLLVFLVVNLLTACSTSEQNIGLAAAAMTTGILAKTPSNELEQIYYLGVFDPQDQLPPMIYRVRVRGQASAFSNMRFASGWVPAPLVDSLSSTIAFANQDNLKTKIERDATSESVIKTNRRLMLFGPEGFREAPAEHRLVIMMGASPEKFFNAIDSAVGTVAQATQQQSNAALTKFLFQALVQLKAEREQLHLLAEDTERDLTFAGDKT